MERLLILALTTVCLARSSEAADWGYSGPHGPDHWVDNYPLCGRTKQSPIDIPTSSVALDDGLGQISFTGYGTSDQSFTLKNTGHGVQVDVSGGAPIQISGSGLPGNFELVQFHVHWGTSDATGSEHLVGGKQYPMEVHLVHYNKKYADFPTALPMSDGLAVIGAFFEVSGGDNSYIQGIVDKLGEITYKGDSTSITAFEMNNLLPDKSTYYRYDGSLTTPTCDESVTWTVLDSTIKLSQAQMQAFRSGLYEGTLSNSTEIEFNFRPVQNLNGRTVKSNFNVNSAHHVTGHVTAALVALVISALV